MRIGFFPKLFIIACIGLNLAGCTTLLRSPEWKADQMVRTAHYLRGSNGATVLTVNFQGDAEALALLKTGVCKIVRTRETGPDQVKAYQLADYFAGTAGAGKIQCDASFNIPDGPGSMMILEIVNASGIVPGT